MHRLPSLLLSLLLLLLLSVGSAADSTADAGDQLKLAVHKAVHAQRAQILEQGPGLNRLLRPAAATFQGQEETPAARLFLQRLNRIYARVIAPVSRRIPSKLEIQASDDFFSGFFMEGDNDPVKVRQFTRLVKRLGGPERGQALEYRVGVLGGGGFDAFAKGGRYVVITDGFADIPPGETAAVLAHEMAHLAQRHFLMFRIITEVNAILQPALDGDPKLTARALQYGAMRFQRQLEYEADSLALSMLRRAGYSTDNLTRMLERVLSGTAGRPGRMGDDHPTLEARLAAIRRHLAR